VIAFCTFAVWLLPGLSAPPQAAQAGRAQSKGIELIVRTPEPERFEAALDEIELQWRDERGAAVEQARTATGLSRATVERTTAGGAIFAIRDVAEVSELVALLREVEAQNPLSIGYIVLYEAGRPRNEATRRLLGREIAVLLADDADRDAVLQKLSGVRVSPVPSVPRAYVVEAADPMSALAMADVLRTTPGVKTAYALLQRRAFPR
jgi:hypothetical protein